MPNYFRRRWRYMMAKASGDFEERADPKVQLEQAIVEAQDQHRRLVEQAANVVANQKQTEMQLNRAMEELEKVSTSTRQALRMAADAGDRGDAQKSTEYNQTAEAFANRLIATENQVNDLKTMSLQTAQAAQQAKAAVQQNSSALQQKLAERQKLMSQLDQAKMQEQLNAAMGSLSATVDQDTPTLDQVRSKIEQRYARALGTSEVGGQGVEARMLEVEQAAMGSEAQNRLAEMRQTMGLGPGDAGDHALSSPSSGELGEGTARPSAVAEPATKDQSAEP
ncbi:MAG: PspA/IM30 family protein [Actinomycetota bacterium]|nr:PspA/IM30 family protein [Actinomycetota bacterium]